MQAQLSFILLSIFVARPLFSLFSSKKIRMNKEFLLQFHKNTNVAILPIVFHLSRQIIMPRQLRDQG